MSGTKQIKSQTSIPMHIAFYSEWWSSYYMISSYNLYALAFFCINICIIQNILHSHINQAQLDPIKDLVASKISRNFSFSIHHLYFANDKILSFYLVMMHRVLITRWIIGTCENCDSQYAIYTEWPKTKDLIMTLLLVEQRYYSSRIYF